MKYRRPYHDSISTDFAIKSVIPSWMKMNEKDSIGWQFLNALFGMETELIDEAVRRESGNLFLPTADPLQLGTIYKTTHDTSSGPLGIGSSGSADGTVTLIEADDIYSFTNGPATRVGDAALVGYFTEDNVISGLEYVVDYDPSGYWVMKDGYLHGAYVVNLDVDLQDTAIDHTIVYAEDGEQLRVLNFGRKTQTYEVKKADDLLNLIDGEAKLKYTPIASSVKILDILNLDPTGNASEVDATGYTINGDLLLQETHNPYTNPNPWKSTYIAEYKYPVSSRLGPITTTESIWGVSRWSNFSPVCSRLPEGNLGKEIPYEIHYSKGSSDIVLLTDPEYMRPGATGTVVVEHMAEATLAGSTTDYIEWDMLDEDPGFLYTESAMLSVVSAGSPDATSYALLAFGENGHVVSLKKYSAFPSTGITVRYKKKTEIPATGIQTLSSTDASLDPYPSVYYIEDGKTYPRTAIEVAATGAASQVLSSGTQDKIHVYCPSDYVGVAYNRFTNKLWYLDNNNQQLHVIDPFSFKIEERNQLFLSDGARTSAEPTGHVDSIYPFINLEKNDSMNCGPCAFNQDWLYVVDGSSMYSINSFDPDFAVEDTFTVPTGIADITVNKNGDFDVAIGTGIYTIPLYHDYMIIDRENGIIYYREKYGYVELDGVVDG